MDNVNPDQRVRYCRKSLPPSVDDAQERLDILEDEIARIVAQLEYTNQDDFVSLDAYLNWKGSAVAALGYKRAEYAFVERWLNEQSPKQCSPEMSNHFSAMKEAAVSEAEKLKQESLPVLSCPAEDATLDYLKEQRGKLGSLIRKIDSNLSRVKAVFSASWGNEEVARLRTEARAPWVELRSEANSVLESVNALIKAKSTSQ